MRLSGSALVVVASGQVPLHGSIPGRGPVHDALCYFQVAQRPAYSTIVRDAYTLPDMYGRIWREVMSI